MKKAKIVLLITFLASLVFFNSCKSPVIYNNDSQIKYGSLTVSSKSMQSSNSRSSSVSDIASFSVYVTSSDIKYQIKSSSDQVLNGKGEILIEDIPVGRNRIITAYPYDAAGNVIDDFIRRTVIDIVEGPNSCDEVSKKTSCRGNVYNALLASKVDIAKMTDNQIAALERVIPTVEDCENDLNRIDYQSIVDDYCIGVSSGSYFEGKTAENYILPSDVRYLQRVYISETNESTQENPTFKATAVYSDSSSPVDVTDSENIQWVSTNSEVLTVENGKVTLLSDGVAEVQAVLKDLESDITRYSPLAKLTVTKVTADSGKIYLCTKGSVDFAKDNAVVLAWIWNTKRPGSWYEFEVCDDNPDYMYLDLPLDSESIIFARGRSYNSSNPTVWGSLDIWNKTSDLQIPSDLKELNTFTPDEWNMAKGKWSYNQLGNQEGAVYASVEMEPSEDDSTLSEVFVNGSKVSLSRYMAYTISYDDSAVEIFARPNSNGALVDYEVLTQSGNEVHASGTSAILSNPGSYITYKIVVTAKDGLNTSEYTLKVRRSAVEDYNSDANKKKCYIEDTENGTITFVCSPDLWTSVSNTGRETITVRGSFTASYNETTKKWEENDSEYAMTWDATYGWYYLTVDSESIKRPGYSGQPEYRFYYGTLKLPLPEELNSDYIFESNQNLLVFFEEDKDSMSQVLENGKNASYIAEESEFGIVKTYDEAGNYIPEASEENKAKVSNFRKVPGTSKLYRTYHPYYPSHANSPLDDERIIFIQKYYEEYGIKSDINLCNNREGKAGLEAYIATYVGDSSIGSNWTISIPDYYQSMLNNDCVLYVGDTEADSSANGYIPSGKLVYYHSDSAIFGQWIGQICNFIDTHQGPYSIHCEIGIDRTGVFSAVFAGLCGATWAEIKEDYEKSNEMKIAEFRDSRILKYSLENMLNVKNIEEVNLSSALETYFVSKGYVSQSVMNRVIDKLTE